jgi:hypothetical protein
LGNKIGFLNEIFRVIIGGKAGGIKYLENYFMLRLADRISNVDIPQRFLANLSGDMIFVERCMHMISLLPF